MTKLKKTAIFIEIGELLKGGKMPFFKKPAKLFNSEEFRYGNHEKLSVIKGLREPRAIGSKLKLPKVIDVHVHEIVDGLGIGHITQRTLLPGGGTVRETIGHFNNFNRELDAIVPDWMKIGTALLPPPVTPPLLVEESKPLPLISPKSREGELPWEMHCSSVCANAPFRPSFCDYSEYPKVNANDKRNFNTAPAAAMNTAQLNYYYGEPMPKMETDCGYNFSSGNFGRSACPDRPTERDLEKQMGLQRTDPFHSAASSPFPFSSSSFFKKP